MIQMSPKLRKKLNATIEIKDGKNRIVFLNKASFICALPSEAKSADGINASCIVLDELAELTGEKGRAFYDKLEQRTKGRAEPLFLQISTAGTDATSVFAEQVEYSKKVISGAIIDTEYLPIIYAADESDDPWNEATWQKANPSLGITLPIENLRSLAREAKAIPAKESAFRRYNLSQHVSTDSIWIPDHLFAECCVPVDVDSLLGMRGFGGADLSMRRDVTASCVLVPQDDDTFDCLFDFWLPKEGIEKKGQEDGFNYSSAIPYGLTLTDGDIIDYQRVAERLTEQASQYDIVDVGIDRAYAKYLYPLFEKYGCINGYTCNFIEVPQTPLTLTEPCKQLESWIKSKKIRFGVNPLLRWMNSNAKIEITNTDLYILKKGKQKKRIDGLFALLMAIQRYMIHGTVEQATPKIHFI